VDTLEASFVGELDEQVVEALEEKKGQAQADDLPVAWRAGRWLFYVQSHGAKPWRFQAKHEDMWLNLCTHSRAGQMFAKLSALGLAAHGHRALYAEVAEIAEGFGLTPGGIARIDIAIDFQGWAPTVAEMGNVVCRARNRPIHPNLEDPETFYFRTKPLVVRIYNKTKELKEHHKEWMREVWKDLAGYDPSEDVWRFEVQVRRPVLKQLGSTDAEAVFTNLGPILGFALDWCNLRVPTGENKSRWPEDPKWTELRHAACTGEPAKRAKVVHYLSGYSRTVLMVLGYLVSGAAWLDIYDFDTAWRLLERTVRGKMAEGEKDFETLVRERKRKYAR
jgi:hypothetical protein